jgi:hypothetical protein
VPNSAIIERVRECVLNLVFKVSYSISNGSLKWHILPLITALSVTHSVLYPPEQPAGRASPWGNEDSILLFGSNPIIGTRIFLIEPLRKLFRTAGNHRSPPNTEGNLIKRDCYNA